MELPPGFKLLNSKCSLSLNRDLVLSLQSHLTQFRIVISLLIYHLTQENSLLGYYPPGNQRFPAKQYFVSNTRSMSILSLDSIAIIYRSIILS